MLPSICSIIFNILFIRTDTFLVTFNHFFMIIAQFEVTYEQSQHLTVISNLKPVYYFI